MLQKYFIELQARRASATVRDMKNYCALPTIVGLYLTVEHAKSYITNLRLTYIPANLVDSVVFSQGQL